MGSKEKNYFIMNIYTFNEKRYVAEGDFWNTLKGMRKLVRDQRMALRNHNPRLIDDCKDREQQLLNWIDKYEETRNSWLQLNLFEEERPPRHGGHPWPECQQYCKHHVEGKDSMFCHDCSGSDDWFEPKGGER